MDRPQPRIEQDGLVVQLLAHQVIPARGRTPGRNLLFADAVICHDLSPTLAEYPAISVDHRSLFPEWSSVLPRRPLNTSVISAPGLSEFRTRSDAALNSAPGAHEVFLSPGLPSVTAQRVFETSIQLPIVQALAGGAAEAEYRLVVGVRFQW